MRSRLEHRPGLLLKITVCRMHASPSMHKPTLIRFMNSVQFTNSGSDFGLIPGNRLCVEVGPHMPKTYFKMKRCCAEHSQVIGFGAMPVNTPSKSIQFGDTHGPKPHIFRGRDGRSCHRKRSTRVNGLRPGPDCLGPRADLQPWRNQSPSLNLTGFA